MPFQYTIHTLVYLESEIGAWEGVPAPKVIFRLPTIPVQTQQGFLQHSTMTPLNNLTH